MLIDIVVPPLSQTSDTLVLTGWLKKVGDPVSKGEALFEVETDKATLEVEAPATGILREVLVEPGAEVAVKARIGSIAVQETAAVAVSSPPAPGTPHAPNPDEVRSPASQPFAHHPPTHPLPAERAERILASPRARGLAEKEGVPLQGIRASGPRGLIVERDVRAHLAELKAAGQPAASAPASPIPQRPTAEPAATAPLPTAQSRRVPQTATRRTIARRLQASQQSTTPVTLTRDVDATELVALRERILLDLAGQGVRPSYTDFLVSIVARCLQRHPTFNATFDGEQLEIFDDAVHMGLAVNTDRGLLVPVLRHVEGQGLLALARQRTALVRRAVEGALRADELSGGTFTLTNLGPLGVDAFTPLLNPPQIAILGLGRIRTVAGPVGNTIGLRQAMFLSLTFDHRAVDGAPAARLLVDIANLVERPDRVWL
jgi:pyruvate/2-oxoglutarate dehydrogenase complex dihydrolipoamide acyltransferase (E2) component